MYKAERNRWAVLWVVGCVPLLALAQAASRPASAPAVSHPASAPAGNHPGYTTRAEHDPDGTGKFYMGREIAQVMGHEGADWLDRPEREQQEHAKELIESLKLRPGDVVADIGAGSGYHTLSMAGLVGPAGRVKAVDIQQEMLDLIRKKRGEAGLHNIDLVLGTADDPKLPGATVDLVLMVDVYHEFEFPFEMMQRIVHATRPGGRIVFVEFRLEDSNVPIKLVHKMSEAQVIKEMKPHGLKHKETIRSLPWQHVIVFERPAAPASRGSRRELRKEGHRMRNASIAITLLFVLSLSALSADNPATRPAKPWLGVHTSIGDDRAAETLIQELPELAAIGVNTLVIEVNYSFEFKSHPELRGDRFLSREQARKLGDACRKNGIRPIPQLNCLGHQSWDKHTAALLTKYPQFDETPGQYPENKDIYCRSWCPQHPEVNAIVFELMDELIDAFKADAFHVGLDEVFLIASEHCSRCKGKSTADMFAKAVNDYHGHLVGKRKVEMLMWADRLLDAKTTGYGEWEAAKNGTSPAIDKIPKDIVMCDWHYGKRDSYPSIPFFIEKGFRVWPSGWDKVDATEALADDALKHSGPRMLGYLCTIWGKARPSGLAEFPPVRAAMKKWKAGN